MKHQTAAVGAIDTRFIRVAVWPDLLFALAIVGKA